SASGRARPALPADQAPARPGHGGGAGAGPGPPGVDAALFFPPCRTSPGPRPDPPAPTAWGGVPSGGPKRARAGPWNPRGEGGAEAQARVTEAQAESAAALAALREGIAALLVARGIVCSDEARERLSSCTDAATLQRWLLGAVSASAVEEVFSG